MSSTTRPQPRIIPNRPFLVEGWRSRGLVCRRRHYIGAIRVPRYIQRLYMKRWRGAETAFAMPWKDIPAARRAKR